VERLTRARLVHVLCVNVGSSSLKLALWDATPARERRLAHGTIVRTGVGVARLELRCAAGDAAPGATVTRDLPATEDDLGVAAVLEALAGAGLPAADAIGHRIVHGGPDHVAPERVTQAVLAALEQVVPFAPLHLPRELAVVRALASAAPELPQVLCFDTAFHARLPAVARRLPLPRALWDEGIRRYGFHGLSYEYVVQALGDDARGRLVIAHLGNGASLAAVRDGAPVDTTMGLTPTGGLMMGTRPGDLDPGVLLHLARVGRLDAAALERLVEQQSGLLGVSGISADVRELVDARASSPGAAEALELFCWIARKHVGAMAASLGGIDRLVFTGGIGEHASEVRAGICAGLAHLGVELDQRRNATGEGLLSRPGARCAVQIVATDEERMLARHARDLLTAAR
jgi:acetate kinase